MKVKKSAESEAELIRTGQLTTKPEGDNVDQTAAQTDIKPEGDGNEPAESEVVEIGSAEATIGPYNWANDFRVVSAHQDEPDFLALLEARLNEIGGEGFEVESALVLHGRIVIIMSR